MNERQEQITGYAKMSDKEFANNFSGKDEEMSEEFKTQRLPDPPAPGEMIICQICNQPIYPRKEKYLNDPHISNNLIMHKDKRNAKREFDFHVHNMCREKKLMLADQNTPGLISERKPLMDLLKKKIKTPKSL
jgi:hypothetical protein